MISLKHHCYILCIVVILHPLSSFAFEIDSLCTTYSPPSMINCASRVLLEARSLLDRGDDGHELVISLVNGTGASILSRALPYIDTLSALQVPEAVTSGLHDLTKDTLAPTLGAAHVRQIEVYIPTSLRAGLREAVTLVQNVFTNIPDAVRSLEKDMASPSVRDASGKNILKNNAPPLHTDTDLLNSPSFDGEGFITK